MKRIYQMLFLALGACCLMASCTKADVEPADDNEIIFEPIDDNQNSENQTPESNEKGIVIKLDGSFDDWNQEGIVSSTEAHDTYNAITELKSCVSSKYIYIYYKSARKSDLYNVRLVVDCDNDASTGDKHASLPSTGYSFMANMTAATSPSNAGFYEAILGGDSYLENLSGSMDGKATVDGENIEVEMSISRETLEKIFPIASDKIRICMYALNSSWGFSAIIPTSEPLIVPVVNGDE